MQVWKMTKEPEPQKKQTYLPQKTYQSILKLRLFTSVLFDKKVWWFLSAALKFHPTFQISVELNLFLKAFSSLNLEMVFYEIWNYFT
jgi:hypothetical protein